MFAMYQPITQSKHIKEMLNAHGINPFVRRANLTGEFVIQFNDRNFEHGTAPAELWLEGIKAVLPHIEVNKIDNKHAYWRSGNPVLIATIFADFPAIDLMSYILIMIQLAHIIKTVGKKRLIMMALRFWAFINWWKQMWNQLVYTPKLPEPQTQAITIIKKMPIVESIRQHGKVATLERLHHDIALHGIVAEQKYRDEKPPMKFPSWDELQTSQVITVNL